jgi:hypothetical protein
MATASLIALWLDLRDTMDSGSSKGGGNSDSRPRRPSGEPCKEELFVVSWAVSGDMIGETWGELKVVTDEALIADAGTEGVEEIEGRKLVWTWLGFDRRVSEGCEDWEELGVIVIEDGTSIVAVEVARRDGLGEGEGITPEESTNCPMAQPCLRAGRRAKGGFAVYDKSPRPVMERMSSLVYRRRRAEGWLAGTGEVPVRDGGM